MAGAAVSDSPFEIAPRGLAPLTTGIDDARKERQDPRTHLGASPQTELAQDNPVPQGALGVIVRQRQCRVLQYLEDGLSIIE